MKNNNKPFYYHQLSEHKYISQKKHKFVRDLIDHEISFYACMRMLREIS